MPENLYTYFGAGSNPAMITTSKIAAPCRDDENHCSSMPAANLGIPILNEKKSTSPCLAADAPRHSRACVTHQLALNATLEHLQSNSHADFDPCGLPPFPSRLVPSPEPLPPLPKQGRRKARTFPLSYSSCLSTYLPSLPPGFKSSTPTAYLPPHPAADASDPSLFTCMVGR